MKELVYLPLKMEKSPIIKLMLINFEKNPDTVYKGLEWQYFESEITGNGFRVIAYRLDNYVDVYDDEDLKMDKAEGMEVCGNGLANYSKQCFPKKCFDRQDGKIHVEFQFIDCLGRNIMAHVQERDSKKSRSMNLIAPVGSSSKNPKSLPIYQMFEFDLVRKNQTILEVLIQKEQMIPDLFPVPIRKDGQKRYFTRYGWACDLVDVGKSKEEVLFLQILDKEKSVTIENVLYQFTTIEGEHQLKTMKFKNTKHKFEIEFVDTLPDILRMDDKTTRGRFQIHMEREMGTISGIYSVKKAGDFAQIEITPSGGWIALRDSFLAKIMFGKKSVFCSWPKTYQYLQTVNVKTGESKCEWKRINIRK